MRRYNQRLYRAARAILHDDAEAEENERRKRHAAYGNISQFAGRALFSTWLTRIVVHEALSRLRLRNRDQQLDDFAHEGDISMNMARTLPDPEQALPGQSYLNCWKRHCLTFQSNTAVVMMLRDVEGLSTAETAAALELTEENVKIRLDRGRSMARGWIVERVGANADSAFPNSL